MKTILICMPFLVCLFWLVIFVLQFRSMNSAKKVLAFFLAACVVLYLCHALYFISGLSRVGEAMWAMCSLSVYPLYYIYIVALTSDLKQNKSLFSILAPGILVGAGLFMFPGKVMNAVRAGLFACQILGVCYLGIRRLNDFDKQLSSVYADCEGRDTREIRNLLFAFIFTSAASFIVNAIGKKYFAQSDVALLSVACLFATMLFALAYIGYCKDFCYERFVEDDKPMPSAAAVEAGVPGSLGKSIEALLEGGLYLKKDLKIGDVVQEVGSCRTYVSEYFNHIKGSSFSDCINKMRIEHAKVLLRDNPEAKIYAIAEQCGFMSEQSFFRNFKKYTGQTPSQWLDQNLG